MQKINQAFKKDGRNFGLLLAFFFLLIGAIIPSVKSQDLKWLWIYLSILFIFSSFVFPLMLFELRKYWIKLGNFLGHINSTILFSIIFILVISPITLIFKITGRDLLKLKYKKYASTWTLKESISNFEDIY